MKAGGDFAGIRFEGGVKLVSTALLMNIAR